jgi:hypothetical protein
MTEAAAGTVDQSDARLTDEPDRREDKAAC